VWIEELDIAGFKQLRGTLTFGPGLTVVHGPNEAGKTTLHDAVLRSLFGFSATDRRMRNGSSVLTRSRPWAGGGFGVTALVHEAHEGRSLQIEWNFRDHTVAVHDRDTGDDFSREVRAQRQDISLGRWLLGLDLEDYCQACCLFQVAVEPVTQSDGLVGALRAAVEQGAADGAGVTAADELLRSFLSRSLGLHSRWYTPLTGGQLARLARDLGEAEAALEDATAAREEIRELSTERASGDDNLVVIRRELSILEQRLRLTDYSEFRRRWDEVAHQRERVARNPARPVTLPAAQRERVATLRRQVDRERQRVFELQDEVAKTTAAVAELEQQRRACTQARDRLGAYAEWDASKEALVRGLQAQLRGLDDEREDPVVPPPTRDPELVRFRAERETLRGLTRGETSPSWRRDLLTVAIALAALSAVGAMISPLALIGLGLAAIVALVARRTGTSPERDGLAEALDSFGVDSLQELERRVEAEDTIVATAQGRAEERERQRRERAESRSRLKYQLRDALISVGMAVDDAPQDAADGYLTGCSQHAELAQLIARVNALEAELLRAREPQRDLNNRRHELTQLETALLTAYAENGIQAADLVEGDAAYVALASQAQADEEIVADVRKAQEALRVALDGQTIVQFATGFENAKTRLRQHVAQHGELATDPGDRTELSRRVSELHERIETLASSAAALAARIDAREAESGDPAALEEHLALLHDRQQRMERAGQAIRIARDGLASAAREAHRAFAPHLNSALARDLPRITGGRYARATVGDTLDIMVVVPETGALVSVEALSRGTQDQIALVERLALARMLDPTTGSAPLLLDDPLGHTDPERRRQALELIAELAASRQIVLTTEDPTVAELAEQLSDDVHRIDLPGPSARDETLFAEQAAR